MVTLRLNLLLVALALSACAQMEPAHDKRAVINHTLATTVQLFVEREGGVRRAGSAVILAANQSDGEAMILTTAHLLEPPAKQMVYVATATREERAQAEIVTIDPDRDLALLTASFPGVSQIKFATGAELADEVLVVAFPWGRRRTVVNGAVSQISVEESRHDPPLIWGAVSLVDASVSYGMSGGGVFDKRSGRLVGMVRGYRTVHLSLSSDQAPLKLPIAGETTVIPTSEIVCFLRSVDLEHLVTGDVTSEFPRRLCEQTN